ncbi:MAG TPA: S9 family peptidase [Candidatus Saccharimonadales bacterium]|nr:S9 family peptidase [Candidatus Saccharimonadales bacterium]
MRTKSFRSSALTGLLLLLCLLPAPAQLSTNMQAWMRRLSSSEFSGAPGGGGRGAEARDWVDGGAGYTVVERDGAELARYDTATGERKILLTMTPAQRTPPGLGGPLPFDERGPSADGKHILFSTKPRPTMIRKTAYEDWVLDKNDNSWRKLGGNSTNGLLYAKLSPDGTRAAYVRDNNIYVEDVHSGKITRLTRDGSPLIINGTSDWVDEEELRLASCFDWSPDGRKIAYLQFDQSDVPEFSLINYTDTLYPVITRYRYPKAGQTNAAVRIGVVSAKGGATRWIKAPGDPRNTYIARMAWADNSDELILQQLNRLQNTNNVFLANARTGNVRLMYQDRDDAWVDYNHSFIWLEHGRKLLFLTERDGWRRAYAVQRDGSAQLITTGLFDLIAIARVDETNNWLYYTASPDNATQRYLWRSHLDGTGQPERLTPAGLPGTHTYDISPDGRWAFHTYSKFDEPEVSDLIRLPEHTTVRVLQDNAALKAKIAFILAGRTELFQVDGGDGAKLDGWLIRPAKFDPAKKYPLIVSVYGEPGATTVNDSWGGTNRLLLVGLADDGYLIASFDNAGTPAPKGRAWRKVVYGSVGVLSSRQQAAAVRSLAAMHAYVDLDRVGVYGWSGGGSMTLNLMFRSPELYKVGVAGAPVPDETLYDSIYQERYMGLPADNPAGYKAGSPITHAGGLQGKLLIIHGTGDDNVHFQGTQRLLNKLIELNKQFSFMEYPNRRHGLTPADLSHRDILRFGFFEQYLPAGGR